MLQSRPDYQAAIHLQPFALQFTCGGDVSGISAQLGDVAEGDGAGADIAELLVSGEPFLMELEGGGDVSGLSAQPGDVAEGDGAIEGMPAFNEVVSCRLQFNLALLWPTLSDQGASSP
jgi:hypothetical protein